MPVDSFKWMPPSLANYYRNLAMDRAEVPWTPLTKPLTECRFSLLSTAGVYIKGEQEPFDVEREKREPRWGDPTYRSIPRDLRQDKTPRRALVFLHQLGNQPLEFLLILSRGLFDAVQGQRILGGEY